MEKKFILVHKISRKGRNDLPHLIAVDQIISLIEIDATTYIQIDRASNGKTRLGIPVRESFEELCKKLFS